MACLAVAANCDESTQGGPFSFVYIQPADDFPELPQSKCENRVELLETAAQRLG